MSDKETKEAGTFKVVIPPKKYFDLAERPTALADKTALGLDAWTDDPWWKLKKGGQVVQVVAVDTGSKRTPQAGEWYLSGAIVQAYRAPNDLTTPYKIAKLVCVKRVIKWEEV